MKQENNLENIKIIEKELNYKFPQEYINYLLEINKINLKNKLFMTTNGKEKIISHLYSIEPDDKKYILKHQKFDSELEEQIIPFASLEFGDMLCFEKETNNIVLYDHEADIKVFVSDNWNKFIDTLYDEENTN